MDGGQKLKAQHLRALRGELERAKADLARWESLGERFGKTSSPKWRNTKTLREGGIRNLEGMIEQAERM